jgi:hypothetical protein
VESLQALLLLKLLLHSYIFLLLICACGSCGKLASFITTQITTALMYIYTTNMRLRLLWKACKLEYMCVCVCVCVCVSIRIYIHTHRDADTDTDTDTDTHMHVCMYVYILYIHIYIIYTYIPCKRACAAICVCVLKLIYYIGIYI